MSTKAKAVLGTVLSIAVTFAVSPFSAAVRTSGKESIRGQIVAPAKAGTRHAVSSIVVAEGVFPGAGKIVEVANRPGDPDAVSRDDLAFPGGTLHIRNTSQRPKVSVDQQTCALTGSIEQTTKVQAGTGKFRHASGTFTGTTRAWGGAARNPDGTLQHAGRSSPRVLKRLVTNRNGRGRGAHDRAAATMGLPKHRRGHALGIGRRGHAD